ncbi:MAG: sortase domain-containing protein [Dermatophilaceae bacterium]
MATRPQEEEQHVSMDSTQRWRLASGGAAIVAVLAVGGLVVQALTGPDDATGTPLAQARSSAGPSPSTTTPSATPSASRTPSATPTSATTLTVPKPKIRDASLDTLTATAAAPTRISIPDLDVDATVDAVGVQKDGAMVIPAAPTSVGWYRYGSAPSSKAGNTVIAGHVATREDGAGAFAPLKGAEKGMRITVTDAEGTKRTYTVIGRERIFKKKLPVGEIFARDGTPLLVLVTCGGEYIRELRSHRDNIVVTAAPVD